MEQQGFGLIGFERDRSDVKPPSVPKRDACAQQASLGEAAPAPAPVARLDLARKILLGVAGVLTLSWFGFLAWGALHLVWMLFF